MNHRQKLFSPSRITLAVLLAVSPMAMAAPGSSLSNFAILSAAPINTTTNIGTGAVALTGSVVNGDVGSSGPAASVVLVGSTVNGSIIAPVSAGVVNAFNTALANGLALTCNQTLAQDAYTDQVLPLASGVTCSATAALTLTRTTLVLNGSGPWTVVVSSAPAADGSRTGALTGTGLNVVMADGTTPAPCDAITWYVAQAATLTGNSVGTIYAGAAITSTGVAVTPPITTFNGSALAGAGVTMTDTTVTACAATLPPPNGDGDHDGDDGDHDGDDGDHDGDHDGHHDGHHGDKDKHHGDKDEHDSGYHNNPFGSHDKHDKK